MIGIGVIDVGSPRSGKLGWAILEPGRAPQTGGDLDAFVEAVAATGARAPLAIGFEAPLFIPTRAVALDVLSGRSGEGSRPWNVGAGAAATTAALAVVTYTLAGRAAGCRLRPPPWTGRDRPRCQGVLFFEAFVNGSAKGLDHPQDALIAAEALQELLEGDQPYRSAVDEAQVFNLLGASLLRTGWSSDQSVLSAACLVVKPGFDHWT